MSDTDIPDDCMETAATIARPLYLRMDQSVAREAEQRIARAIADERLREREAIAEIADGVAAMWRRRGGELLREGFSNQTALDRQATASEIARIIRERSQ